VELDGRIARLGNSSIELPGGAEVGKGSAIELGIRPEYLRIGREGLPVRINKIEDIGRHKIVRAELEGRELAVVVPEHNEIPAEPRLSFEAKGINLYADSWRLELGA
jgi:glycerol transport system ATP-binding protein